MKLRNHQFSTQPQIFERYKHPWYEHNERLDKLDKQKIKYRISDDCPEDMRVAVYNLSLNKPNPPTLLAIEKAKFIEKTYHWNRDDSVRPRNQRSAR